MNGAGMVDGTFSTSCGGYSMVDILDQRHFRLSVTCNASYWRNLWISGLAQTYWQQYSYSVENGCGCGWAISCVAAGRSDNTSVLWKSVLVFTSDFGAVVGQILGLWQSSLQEETDALVLY